jgi:geranylgeranyl diphosphate synthase type II
MSDISNYLQLQSQQIEKRLEQLLPIKEGPYQLLMESARYSLLGGGKRLRPILALTVVQMLQGNTNQSLSAACTLELIHTYSLIHDDLPCMDNDDYRRGKLTLHRQYSEGHAVLTGDFLLTYAFEVLATDPHLTPEKKVKLITILSKQSGYDGMIGGQVLDLASEGQKINLETLQLLHRNKTAALITASVEFGGVLADATEEQLKLIQEFGENIGLAFQITDDILDVTSSETKHGRQVASDILKDKSTYVSLLGLEQAKTYALNFYQNALQALKPLPYNTSFLIHLADFIIHRHY